MKVIFLALVALVASIANAQQRGDTSKVELHGFSTEFLVSTDLKAAYFNFIGAGVKFTKGETTVSLSVFPALRFYNDNPTDKAVKPKPFVTPGLAVGPLLQHKQLLIGAPVFYVPSEARWYVTVGVGYVFGKKKNAQL